MSAKLEISLYVSTSHARVYAWDDVEITLKDGRTVKGTVLPIESTKCIEVNTEQGVAVVYPEDIKDCKEV